MMTHAENLHLFEVEQYDDWRPLWEDMPAYTSEDVKPFDSINVQFANQEDRRRFLQLMGESPERRKSIWYPSVGYLKQSERNATPVTVPAGRYPIYVISKGRWQKPLTHKALERLGIPHFMVIEPIERASYEMIGGRHHKFLELPFHDLGQGSIPARNWVWEHARQHGHARHWILDDNLDGFYRLHENLKTRVHDVNPFESIERWVDRYENVPMAGMNYEFFADRRSKQPPIRLNTRVYSCILLTNDEGLPVEGGHRWRGRYNEDTDLSLRYLKSGHVTALFNHMLCKKLPTMTMEGGNTDELYEQNELFDGRLEMARSLAEQHPDCVSISWKWNRHQHHVDYSPFRFNELQKVRS